MSVRPSFEGWTARWWVFATGIVLMIPVDLLTTSIAISRYGLGVEANPIVRWLFSQGVVYVVGVNLVVAILVIVLFSRLVAVVEETRPPYDRYLSYGIDVWLGLLLVGGTLLMINNIVVILSGSGPL